MLVNTSLVGWSRVTTSASAEELTLDGSTPNTVNRFSIPKGKAFALDLLVAAKSLDGAFAWWKIACGAINPDGISRLVGPPVVLAVQKSAAASAWEVVVSADDDDDCLRIAAKGSEGVLVEWIASGLLALTS